MILSKIYINKYGEIAMGKNAKNKRIHSFEEKTVVDYATGEIKQQETIRTGSVPSEPPFIKMYIDDLADLTHIQKGPRGLLYELAKRVDYDGYISLNKIIRKKIADALKLESGTFSNYLMILKKKHLLHEECRNVFTLNPYFFAKGEWKDIYHSRKTFDDLIMSIKYKSDGSKEITTELVQKKVQLELIQNDNK